MSIPEHEFSQRERPGLLFFKIFKMSSATLHKHATLLYAGFDEDDERYAEFVGNLALDAFEYFSSEFPSEKINVLAKEMLRLNLKFEVLWSPGRWGGSINYVKNQRDEREKGIITLPKDWPFILTKSDVAPFVEFGHLIAAASYAVDQLKEGISDGTLLRARARARVAEYGFSLQDVLYMKMPSVIQKAMEEYPNGFPPH